MKTKSIIGIIIIIVGISFLIEEIFALNFFHIIFDWWPLLIIFYGISQINKVRNLTTPVMIIIVGLFLLLQTLDVLQGNILRNVIALILILAGIQLFTGNKKTIENTKRTGKGFSVNSFFSGNHHIVDDSGFSNGNITAVFGGAEIDFRNASIENEAFLDVTCVFGGVELKVPENWEIRADGTPFFGGFENKTHQKNNNDIIRPVLNINYSVIFGGISMKN
jgi:predicted membrane protein